MTKNIEQEITFAHETDTKGGTVFRFGHIAVRTPALKIQDPVKVRGVKCMNERIHASKAMNFMRGSTRVNVEPDSYRV